MKLDWLVQLRSKYGKKGIPLWAFACAIIGYFGVVGSSLLAPMMAPNGGRVATMLGLSLGFFVLFAVWLIGFALLVRPLQGLAVVAIIWGLVAFTGEPLREFEEGKWSELFNKSKAANREFLAFMKQVKTDMQLKEVPLPASLQGLAEEDVGVRFVDDEGRVFYLYSVFTYSIDNSKGFAWSESGLPPPRPAFHEIVHTKPLGGGWYLFSTT
jgi:hypothetical protein